MQKFHDCVFICVNIAVLREKCNTQLHLKALVTYGGIHLSLRLKY